MNTNTTRNIYIIEYLRIGDRVAMHMDPEGRSWGRKGVPDGTQGTVVKLPTYEYYESRVNGFRDPGKYIGMASPVVKWDTGGLAEQVGPSDISWVNDPEGTRAARQADRVWYEPAHDATRIADLPDLPIWEQDIVRVRRREGIMLVHDIFYRQLDDRRDDGTIGGLYNCTPLGGGYTTTLDAHEVSLHDRGNVWKWYNDKSKLSFDNVQEEAAFYRTLGRCTQIQNPGSANYGWTLWEVLDALDAGTVDCFSTGGMFDVFLGVKDPVTPDSSRHYAYKYMDEDVGRRVREATIAGFKDMKRPSKAQSA